MIHKLYKFVYVLIAAGFSTTLLAQDPYPCTQTANQIPNFSSTYVKVNPNDLSSVIDNDGNYTYNVGDVFRYQNVVTNPANINAYIRIEAMVNATINNWDNNAAGIAQRFQPRISPSPQNMTTDQEGYIQFSIEFRENTFGLPIRFLNPGLRYRHYDIDGTTNGSTGSFIETGWATGQVQVFVNNISEITYGGQVTSGGYTWTKILGSTTEHNSVSSDPEVIYTSVYGPLSVVRFRMGYRFIRGNGPAMNVSYREYAAEFGCFDLSNNSTLPVRLLSFGGTYSGSNAVLNWTTENEVKFKEYVVERSIDGRTFTTAGTVAASSPTGARKEYLLTDNLYGEPANTFYYRLKMVDMDGKFSYSQTIVIRKADKKINGVVINPNPVIGGTATVRFSSAERGFADLRVLDYSGRAILSQRNTVYQGNNSIAINNLERLQPGVYMLQMINDAGEIVTSKFSVSR